MTKKKNKAPIEAHRLTAGQIGAEVKLSASEEGDSKKFSGIALSGKPIIDHWYYGTLAIDLDGIQLPKKSIPVLLEHDSALRIGKTAKGGGFSITEDGLVVDGQLLSNPDAARVLSDAKEGFPWQMSVYIPPNSVERVDNGATAEVNGYELSGPATIFRSARIREVSFCALGADENTSAEVLNEKQGFKQSEVYDMDPKEMQKAIDEAVANALKDAEAKFKESKESEIKLAVEQERARVIEILEACEDFPKLATGFVKDGAEPVDALKAVNKALRENPEAARLAEIKEAHGEPVGTDEAPAKEKKTVSLKDEYEGSVELQEEFGSFEAFEAYKQAEKAGLVKVYGMK